MLKSILSCMNSIHLFWSNHLGFSTEVQFPHPGAVNIRPKVLY